MAASPQGPSESGPGERGPRLGSGLPRALLRPHKQPAFSGPLCGCMALLTSHPRDLSHPCLHVLRAGNHSATEGAQKTRVITSQPPPPWVAPAGWASLFSPPHTGGGHSFLFLFFLFKSPVKGARPRQSTSGCPGPGPHTLFIQMSSEELGHR